MSQIIRIGVVSDTHGHVPNTEQAVKQLREHEVSHVIHCGDIGTGAVVPLFAEWPTHFVFGNVDREKSHLQSTIEGNGQTSWGEFGELQIGDCRIAFTHGHDSVLLERLSTSGAFDIVCSGHTHVAKLEVQNDIQLLNPGALYRADPHSYAIIELPSQEIKHYQLITES
ncbi:phosphodiesterase [Polystyrenella longa]|uniref:Phosphoesterase n=1 Tax=Polystyrenella longa TaxID=2528007 RepID=A0A518CIN3_9PLAN|nr:YfcE family phosphodiesterase [Polystyrenella longa]QDU79095.1 phosphodiesterase [Polystyrenella longa]